MRKIIVTKKYNNKKLINFIQDSFPNLHINILQKALRKKDIRINNIKVTDNVIIKENDEISIYIVDDLLLGKRISDIKTVFEDENILIVNKPKGISVTDNKTNLPSLTSVLKKQYNYIEPCHRLDINTSGLIIFAKNDSSLEILLEKFKNHEIKKYYKATVYGIPNKEHDILEAFLFKDRKKSTVYISDVYKKNHLKIITEYSILEKNISENTAILNVTLHTGRTHQIRAHLAHIGHPIIGDGKYGINEINKKFGKSSQELFSYKIVFNFKSNSGILYYLNNKEISI